MQSRRRLTLFAAIFVVVAGLLLTIPLFAATGEKVLHSFNPDNNDGLNAYAGLVFDESGNLYGTTLYGGTYGTGIVFELIPGMNGSWTEKVLHNFGKSEDGAFPFTGMIFGASGHLYGTTYGGGTEGDGTVFELTQSANGSWTEKVLHSFGTGQDGVSPEAGLILDQAGNLYGTTTVGGTHDDGAVFELMPGMDGLWSEKILHNFNPNTHDGLYPEAALIFDSSGNLYSTTYGGGTHDNGTVFELIPRMNGSWTEKVLHSFNFKGKDGSVPEAGLIFDQSGNLYGTTTQGGAYDNGTVFELVPAANGTWTETLVHSFNHNTHGGTIPFAGLIFDQSGNLYGTTSAGGAHEFGTVFELTPGKGGKWTEKVLHSFNPNGYDGLTSYCGLIFDQHGHLYGTTFGGGRYGNGTVFEVLPDP
jgi:uncharacterized repeat protein (TIGR03803 family)